ncbi:type III-B CRISPR module RAMP protein Cmr6 [Rosettibacter firmus]|uniref:type III-B CRISPR module RAMP protein Cmr6 n=1 Tax=Rosettibacter firmus TaxID=3111522 RepID=UPI00336C0F63
MSANLSYQYYIAGSKYSNGILLEKNIEFKRDLKEFYVTNDKIWDNNYKVYFKHPLVTGNTKFTLETTYPGLLIGAGYSHGAIHDVNPEDKNDISDFNLGFYFDHTTGFPVIPGSSVKGVLKSVFPKKDFPYIEEKLTYIKDKVRLVNEKASDFIKIDNWEEIFFGKLPMRKHIFCDAYIEEIPDNKKIFEDDYITPHTEGIFKNPKPIRFLKIAPGIKFTFQFVVCDYKFNDNIILTAEHIVQVFKQIILDFGVGAKRNVGYGQFKETKT